MKRGKLRIKYGSDYESAIKIHNVFVLKKLFPLFIIILPILASCSRHKSNSDSTGQDADILVMVGDSALTLRDVLVKIPSGLPSADSILLFQSIIDGWLERNLLTNLAEEKLDNLQEIEQMVEDYRKKLIIASYRRKLREGYKDGVKESEIKGYYNAHKNEFELDRPVVKGLYIKIPSDSKRIYEIRKWMKTATPDAIANLEQYGLPEAIEYSFFTNKWMDWDMLARQIPFRFDNPDSFVSENENFETSQRGITYILHISDKLLSGNQMPYEIASGVISERLSENNGEKYEEKLMNTLYTNARKSGHLKCVNYSPFEHKIISSNNDSFSPR